MTLEIRVSMIRGYPCRAGGCAATSRLSGMRRSHERKVHGLIVADARPDPKDTRTRRARSVARWRVRWAEIVAKAATR